MDLAVHFGRKNNIRPEDLVYMNTRYAFSGLSGATVYMIGGLENQLQEVRDLLELCSGDRKLTLVAVEHDQVVSR